MITAYKSIKKLKNPLVFKTWIIKILINKSNTIFAKKNKKNIISISEFENQKIIAYSNIEKIDITLDFDFICNNLNYEDRTIILLYYMEKFTDKEIGEILNIKENTVKTKRTRAKNKIKDIIMRGEELYG